MTHEHDWAPVPLRMALYTCDCGAQGRRQRDGSIRELRHVHDVQESDVRVRTSSLSYDTCAGSPLTPGAAYGVGVHVRALPTSDTQWRRGTRKR